MIDIYMRFNLATYFFHVHTGDAQYEKFKRMPITDKFIVYIIIILI